MMNYKVMNYFFPDLHKFVYPSSTWACFQEINQCRGNCFHCCMHDVVDSFYFHNLLITLMLFSQLHMLYIYIYIV